MYTPWGESQRTHKIADGIYEVSSASHGGIIVTPERAAEIKALFPEINTHVAGGLAWEEDCDYAIPVLTWPTLFEPNACFYALESVKRWHKEINLPAYLKTNQGIMAQERANAFEQTIVGKWRRGSCMSCKDGWLVFLTRDGTPREVVMPAYPLEAYYSDAELEGLEVLCQN